ncbi:MAG: SAM-dependent DNA methyltransferase [Deltaproteobacteria bacterium]|nr:SAM-dependent DNA methyltransferase [Deltaproteobacteria bacterium]
MQELSIKLPDNIKNSIISAFKSIGYSENMFSYNVGLIGENQRFAKADIVAYSSALRKDSDTAVIGIKAVNNVDSIEYPDLLNFAFLASPIVIFPEYEGISPKLKIFGLNKNQDYFNKLKNSPAHTVFLSEFEKYIKKQQDQFSPRRLERAKINPAPFSLFEVFPNLKGWSEEITQKELINKFQNGVKNICSDNDLLQQQNIIKASIKLLGARILRDREKICNHWSLNSAAELFEQANNFLPGYFDIPNKTVQIIEPLLTKFNSNYNLSQISMETLGRFYEAAFVNQESRNQFGIHYTPFNLAKTLLKRMPVEELPLDKRILCDPTCGSGSLLAAGYERLTEATYRNILADERHRKLVDSIFGNDIDGFASEIARMTLMLFYPPHQNNWEISNLNVEEENFGQEWIRRIKKKPTIIVANPPFGGVGGNKYENVKRTRNQRDRSAFILNRSLNILEKGGLLGIIVTATALDQQLERNIKRRILKECQLLEQWDIPAGWFNDVKYPAVAFIIRKNPPLSKHIYYIPLSDVPAPEKKAKLYNSMSINLDKPPDDLVPTFFISILNKIENQSHRLDNYYSVMNGLKKPRETVIKKDVVHSHLYSGDARQAMPFLDFQDAGRGWIDLRDDNNFPPKDGRKRLRNLLLKNNSILMFKVNNRTSWRSIALKPTDSIAPSRSFHAVFSKSDNQMSYLYALWTLLNHPIASLWLDGHLRGIWIKIEKLKSFPLPNDWRQCVKELSDKAMILINKEKEYIRHDDFSLIESLIKQIDDIIYEIYGINEAERKEIEDYLDMSRRPLTKKFIPQVKKKTEEIKSSNNHQESGASDWRTTFEVSDIFFEEQKIRIVIDGLNSSVSDCSDSDDGLTFKIIPAMPGWMLKKGTTGWIEIMTRSVEDLINFPEKYIIDFSLQKNAYETDEEIDDFFDSIMHGKRKNIQADE